MISGIFHDGSGLGNQLFRYVFTRVKALDLGVDFGMENPELFKGKDFLNLDMRKPVEGIAKIYREQKVVNDDGHDVRPYDPKSELIEDNTEVDGEFQDPKYFMHRIDEIREWLKPSDLNLSFYGFNYDADDVCVINFRGGEYVGVKDLFLTREYWNQAVEEMKQVNPKMKFVVHTDDQRVASIFFPDFEITTGMSRNWIAVLTAPYLILSNSSFAIFPSLLNTRVKKIIAPKFWAGHNKGYWQLEQNQYDKFTYI